MDFITSIPYRIGDAISTNPILLFGLVSMSILLLMLIFDLKKIKTNQLTRQVTARIGKKGEEAKFNLADLAEQLLAKKKIKIEDDLARANVLFTVKEYSTFMLTGIGVGALIGLIIFPLSSLWKGIFFFIPNSAFQDMFGRIVAAAAMGYAGMFFPKFWLFTLISKRKTSMANQIEDVLLNIADALNSGHVINDAIRIVGEETPYPMGPEFSRTYQEMETGKSLIVALEDLKKRVDLQDFTMAINAIVIQYEVGGKLEPLLRNMVKIIAERQELKKEIQKTIATSKLTGIVLLVAPIFFVVVFLMLNKESMVMMTQSLIGWAMIVVAFVFYLIAAWIIIFIIHDVSKET